LNAEPKPFPCISAAKARTIRRWAGRALTLGSAALLACASTWARGPGERPEAEPDGRAPRERDGLAEGIFAAIDIDFADPGEVLAPEIFGQNLPIWTERVWGDPRFIELAAAMRPTVLRFPGGAIADDLRWSRDPGGAWYTPPVAGGPYTGSLTPALVDRFLSLARALGAQPLLQVNARADDPEAAADLVRYVNVERRAGVRWIEIGNEVGLYRSASDYAVTFAAYARAIRAVDPSVRLMASGGFGPKTPPGWTTQIAHAIECDLIAEHTYASHAPAPRLAANSYLADRAQGSSTEGPGVDLQFGWNRIVVRAAAAAPEGLMGLRLHPIGAGGEEPIHIGPIELRQGARVTRIAPRVGTDVHALAFVADARWVWRDSGERTLWYGTNLIEVPVRPDLTPPLRMVGLRFGGAGTVGASIAIGELGLQPSTRGPAIDLLADARRLPLVMALRAEAVDGTAQRRELALRSGRTTLTLPLAPLGNTSLRRVTLEVVTRSELGAFDIGITRLQLRGPGGVRTAMGPVERAPSSHTGDGASVTTTAQGLRWSVHLHPTDGEVEARATLDLAWATGPSFTPSDALELELELDAWPRFPAGLAPTRTGGATLRARPDGGVDVGLGRLPAELVMLPLGDAAGLRTRVEVGGARRARWEGREIVVVPARLDQGSVSIALALGTPIRGGDTLTLELFVDPLTTVESLWRQELAAAHRAIVSRGRQLAITEFSFRPEAPAAATMADALFDVALFEQAVEAGVKLATAFDLVDVTAYGAIQVRQDEERYSLATTARHRLWTLLGELRGRVVPIAGRLPERVAAIATRSVDGGRGQLLVANRGVESIALSVSIADTRTGPALATRVTSAPEIVRAKTSVKDDGSHLVELAPESAVLLTFELP